MFATSQSALASAIREETISRNLYDLALGYDRDGKMGRARELAKLSSRRAENMRTAFGYALRLESEGR